MNLIAYRPLPSSEAVTCRHGGHIGVQINGVVNYGLTWIYMICFLYYSNLSAPIELSENGIIIFLNIYKPYDVRTVSNDVQVG